MNTKQVSYFFIYALITTSLATNIICMEETPKFNPENTKFAFDFHDVVVTEPFSCLSDAKKLLRWDFIPACNRQLPWFIYELLTFIFYTPTGNGFKNICDRYGQKQLINGIGQAANSFKIIEGTIEIMQELKNKGYQLDLASNIETLFLEQLKHDPEYQGIQEKILSLFTNTKSVNHWSTIQLEFPIRKPDIRFFTAYQQEYNPDNKQVIFIDDRQRNILASQEAGMIGIQFKTPEQLRSELVKQGILS